MGSTETTRCSTQVQLHTQDLIGKNALITSGATRGIGRAIALNLARRGATILGTGSSQASMHHFESLATEVAYSLSNSQHVVPRIIGVPADILSADSPARLVDCVEEHFKGKLDILVNNACYDEMRTMGSLDDEYLHRVLHGNIHNPTMLMDLLYRRGYIMPHSRIINVSSVSGRQIPFPAMYVVGASKAFLEALTRTWATLFANNPAMVGTTVNTLLVGGTATEGLLREAPEFLKERAKAVIDSGVPIWGPGGIGRTEDVADVAGLLVSEKARWITGGVVCANGGSLPLIM